MLIQCFMHVSNSIYICYNINIENNITGIYIIPIIIKFTCTLYVDLEFSLDIMTHTFIDISRKLHIFLFLDFFLHTFYSYTNCKISLLAFLKYLFSTKEPLLWFYTCTLYVENTRVFKFLRKNLVDIYYEWTKMSTSSYLRKRCIGLYTLYVHEHIYCKKKKHQLSKTGLLDSLTVERHV